MVARSAERIEFLQDVLATFAEGGIQMVGGIIESVAADGVYKSVTVEYLPDPGTHHQVTPDTIARAFSQLRSGSVELSEKSRKRLLKCDRENDASQMDSVDATNIVEIGLFGEVVYA